MSEVTFETRKWGEAERQLYAEMTDDELERAFQEAIEWQQWEDCDWIADERDRREREKHPPPIGY